MAKKKTTRRKKASQPLPPITEPFDVGERKAAEHCGRTVMALRLIFAAGVIPPEDAGVNYEYLQTVSTAVEVARKFGVSERTVSTWRSKKMPGRPGSYAPEAIRHWRLEQTDPPEELARGFNELPSTLATGDLVRAIFRMLRVDLVRAGRRAEKDFKRGLAIIEPGNNDLIADLFLMLVGKHFDGFRLDDDAIEKLLAETWGLV